MILGIGVDIIEVERIEQSISRFGESFLQRIFTSGEIHYCTGKSNAAQHFAARFAAKEAVSKSLATGWRGAFSWKDIEVTNDPMGQPRIVLHRKLKETLPAVSIRVSLSHSDHHVVAMAIMEEGSA